MCFRNTIVAMALAGCLFACSEDGNGDGSQTVIETGYLSCAIDEAACPAQASCLDEKGAAHCVPIPAECAGAVDCACLGKKVCGSAKCTDSSAGGGSEGFACAGSTKADTDADGAPDADDCAPKDASKNPGAVEACNGIDDDCDAEVDEGCPAVDWAACEPGDAGPGPGSCSAEWTCGTESYVVACESNPAGAFDCDCTVAGSAVHAFTAPAGTPICGESSSLPAAFANESCGWKLPVPGADADTDGDGTKDAGDCSPKDAAIHPGAAELCNGLDDDCDGETDEGCPAIDWSKCEPGDAGPGPLACNAEWFCSGGLTLFVACNSTGLDHFDCTCDGGDELPKKTFTLPLSAGICGESTSIPAGVANEGCGWEIPVPLPDFCGPCTPECTGKECGGDGCGEKCGACPAGTACVYEASCAALCVPNCSGKLCGDDGCGGACGICPEGFTCKWAGMSGPASSYCEPAAGGCAGIPEKGMCISGHKLSCIDGKAAPEICKYNGCTLAEDGSAFCPDPHCIPHCFGRTCGGDGCGGSCGECPEGDVCDAGYAVCRPEAGCGGIGDDGACLGHVLASCAGGELTLKACLEGKRLCDAESCGFAVCRPIQDDEPCGGVGAPGQCAPGSVLLQCEDGSLSAKQCMLSCGQVKVDAMGCK